ncbi:ribosomal protein S18-alanine N-acetyltransferase [Mesobacillus selenatarsenatis]|uniref:[Ribosomal protein bS18]-alanine N-acetyltransferase n=1 Tax=Mesobacillus selenatarsenatis (strain DSM 18680 / JCM 14380 / FERM P-15431 / SF-1) TaxID=1321606 RepID=A0A0A8XA69_MESS1|nr:ribosomal protein S18-alanine N-acetyltransferase [Mesobacillus selenatarsenatis]GAM16184.1 ribosomal-protein-S18p-alanine acetyltransferase [Mesobacillus selenatarsenatis SF-1]
MNKTITFRNMTVDDLDQVMEVEVNSFTIPWSREAFFNELTKNQFAQYLIVEVDQKVVGYCGVWIIIDEAHITNIALLPEYRGMKLGEALMAKVMELAREIGALRVTLEVRVSNERAQNLYRKFGFEEGAIRKQYYTDNMEDALVMWVNL